MKHWTLVVLGRPGQPGRQLRVPKWTILPVLTVAAMLLAAGAWTGALLRQYYIPS